MQNQVATLISQTFQKVDEFVSKYMHQFKDATYMETDITILKNKTQEEFNNILDGEFVDDKFINPEVREKSFFDTFKNFLNKKETELSEADKTSPAEKKLQNNAEGVEIMLDQLSRYFDISTIDIKKADTKDINYANKVASNAADDFKKVGTRSIIMCREMGSDAEKIDQIIEKASMIVYSTALQDATKKLNTISRELDYEKEKQKEIEEKEKREKKRFEATMKEEEEKKAKMEKKKNAIMRATKIIKTLVILKILSEVINDLSDNVLTKAAKLAIAGQILKIEKELKCIMPDDEKRKNLMTKIQLDDDNVIGRRSVNNIISDAADIKTIIGPKTFKLKKKLEEEIDKKKQEKGWELYLDPSSRN